MKKEKKIKKSKEEILNDLNTILLEKLENIIDEENIIEDEKINDEINEDEQILIDAEIEEEIIENAIELIEEKELIDENKPIEEEIVENIWQVEFEVFPEPIIDERIIEGYAIVFNKLSEDLGGFRELIEPQAVTQELINNSDIYYLYNHNGNSMPLARSNKGEGSLQLTIDSKGLKYSFNCLNNEFYNIVQRGDLDKSSFAFSLPIDGEGEIWEKHSEYNYIRRITLIEKLYDCSAVLVPAYSQTSVYARSNDINKNKVEDNYYVEYDNIINKLIKSN